jgi:MFS transporter, ACS family, glucarate transporter
MPPTTARTSTARPTRKRYWVIVFAVTLAILSYIDRVTLSKVAPQISADLHLSKQQMGLVFSSFALAYALFEIPGGWMGDWLGPRRVLMRIVVWWSGCTALMGAVWNHTSMVVLQFLFGAGEAGGFPNLTKAMTVWLPRGERVRAQGIMWMFARWGGAFTPLLVYYVSQALHSWRLTFVLFGSLGAIWAVAFWLWFRDDPRERTDLNEGELALLAENAGNAGGHANVPWAKALASRSVWLLWAQYFCLTYPWYFYITWLPTYLAERRHFTDIEVARFATLPLFLGGVGCLFSGWVSKYVVKYVGSAGRTRRLISTGGFLGAATLLILSNQVEDPVGAILLIGCASFCNDLVMPHAWATCMDVGGKYAGTISGSMNMMGNLAGAVAPSLMPFILSRTGSWDMVIYSMAAMYLVGSLTWPFMQPTKPIEEH